MGLGYGEATFLVLLFPIKVEAAGSVNCCVCTREIDFRALELRYGHKLFILFFPSIFVFFFLFFDAV